MCKALIWIGSILYVAALGIWIISEYGLFGQDSTAFSGIFLVFFGMPWSMMSNIGPESIWPYLTALTPLINILLLVGICKWIRKKG
ncbi:MAG: hypothetical protein L3J37_03240 [Rhodobacteraceae bacterium]|nr:hypothetical protein [Paracoccaceae bacterium]